MSIGHLLECVKRGKITMVNNTIPGNSISQRAVLLYCCVFGCAQFSSSVAAAADPPQSAPSKPPELVLQTGHSGPVRAVEFSTDGKLLATSSDSEVILWDMQTGQELRSLPGTFAQSRHAISPDGKIIVTNSQDKLVVWDLHSGKRLRSLDGVGGTWCLAFSPDGKELAEAGWDGQVGVWNLAEGRRLRQLDNTSKWSFAVAYSPDGSRLAVGGVKAVIFDAGTGQKTAWSWN